VAIPRCLIVAHVYYPEIWDEIAPRLHNLDRFDFDLRINVVEGRATPQWREAACRQFPRCEVRQSPNLGQDIGGTLSLLKHVDLGDYDLVCKLHTKKCEHDLEKGARWREDLVRACLDEPAEVLKAFEGDERVSMVASTNWIGLGTGVNGKQCVQLCQRLGLEWRLLERPWAAGSMFWCRPYIFQALLDAGINQMDFTCAYGLNGTLAHAIERVFGALAASRGEIAWR